MPDTNPSPSGFRIARATAAIALLTVAAVHLDEFAVDHHSAMPTIGSLFLVNVIAASVLGLVLLAPAARRAGGGGNGSTPLRRLAEKCGRRHRKAELSSPHGALALTEGPSAAS
jgi:hypothetical protein